MPNTRFTFKKGIKDTIIVTFDVSELGEDGITGYTVEWFVKKLLNQGYCNIYKTSEDNAQIVIQDGVNGIVYIFLQPEDTSSLDAGDYYFAFQLTNVDGSLVTISPDLAQGEVILLDSAIY